MAFERDYLLLQGEAFQDFFSSIMARRHGPDFTALRPWGADGDQKNDGHLKSSRTVFQCYAPNDMAATATIAKIEADYNGAVAHWRPHMDKWVFVHNSIKGLGPGVHRKLLELGGNADGVQVEHWGIEELRAQVMALSPDALADLFGPMPGVSEFAELGFDDLRAVLESIEALPPMDSDEIRPVPPDKLAHNRLSSDIADILQRGMTKCDLVGRYLESVPDATLGDRIGTSVTRKYQELRGMGHTSDQIFFELEKFVGGAMRTLPKREAAIIAVLAYFFEQCDIFERPSEQPG